MWSTTDSQSLVWNCIRIYQQQPKNIFNVIWRMWGSENTQTKKAKEKYNLVNITVGSWCVHNRLPAWRKSVSKRRGLDVGRRSLGQYVHFHSFQMEKCGFQEAACLPPLPAHEKPNTGRAKQEQEEEMIYSHPACLAHGFCKVNRGQTPKVFPPTRMILLFHYKSSQIA